MRPVQKAFFTDWDELQLRTRYKTIPEKALYTFGLVLIVGFIGTILPGNRHIPLWETSGILKGTGILVGIALLIAALWAGYEWLRLSKDLKGGFKIIRKATVVKKQQHFSQRKYYIWLNKLNEKSRYEVDDAVFARLEEGDSVGMEFAPYSETLLNIQWDMPIKPF